MGDPVLWHRIQFSFTIVYHYLFPQLTMGLALLILILKGIGLRSAERRYDTAARFWVRIFGINFAMGVATGVPLEFQFGTNWAGFTRYAGEVIGQTLAMEGLFAFFLESSFLALLVFGEGRLSRRAHFLSAVALFVGSWLSGYFIIAANAFMQYPQGHAIAADGHLVVADFGAFLLNPWALAEYAHTMAAAVVTGSFVMSAVGAYYVLHGKGHEEQGRLFLRLGTPVGLVASLLVAFPSGDAQAKLVARHQPAALAAMEGRFKSGPTVGITLIGQPNVAARRLDNPVRIPGMLSFLAFGTFHADVAGLDQFPEKDWPDNIELLYYSFHIMAGLGTIFIAIMGIATLLALRGRLVTSRAMLWTLMLAFPFPYIANTAGWVTAEIGRQPWLVYGLFRTRDGTSPTVHSGSTIFTFLGFCGLYTVLGIFFLFLIEREIARGPASQAADGPGGAGHG